MALPQDETINEQPSIDYEALGLEPVEDEDVFGGGIDAEVDEAKKPVSGEIDYEGLGLEPVEEEDVFGVTQEEPIPVTGEEGFLRQVADVPLKIGESINNSIKGITDLFGADNAISQNLSQNADWYRSLLSAQALEDEEEIGRILKDAEDEGIIGQLGAGLEALSVAPVDFVASGVGSLATFAATGLIGRAAAVAGAARAGLTGAAAVKAVETGVRATQVATGAAMGAGIVKGEIYQSVKDEMLAQGKTEEEAKRVAMEAQSYGGKNLDQILLGAGLGALGGATGAEKIIGKVLAKGGLEANASRIGNILKNGFTEAVPEFFQAAQEKVASNFALQREGVDVPITKGVFSQGALEGLVGLGLGAGAGAIEPRIQTPPTKEEVSAAAAETQDVARRSMGLAPATASLVEGEAEQIIQSQAETPDERVARLQREAQEAAGEIELEEEGAGLPPVEPTPPVTPTPEAAVAPVEPVVTAEGAVEPTAVAAPTEPVTPTEPAVEEPAPAVAPRPAVDIEALSPNAKRANRILTNTGVDPETAAFVAQQYQDEIADLGGEELRAFVLDKFEENGGVIPAQMRYSEDQEYYELAFGIGPEEAATLVENAKAQNAQMAQAELEQNKQWRRKDGQQITETQQGVAVAQPEAQAVPLPAGEVPPSPAIEGRRVPLAAPETAVAPAIPQLEPLRRVARAEQTEEDVAGLVDSGFVEVYKGQPVLTQAGLDALPEAERPRLTPEARKIQIDTRTSEAAAEAISKNLRIGVDQVPVDVRMPAGWTLEGDVYVPPQPQEVGQEFTVYRGELPALEGGRQLAGIRDVGELMGIPDSATFAPFTYYSTSEQDARSYLERDAQILRDYQQRFGNEEGLKMFQSLHGFDPRTEGQMVSKKIRPRKVFDMTEMGTVADQFKMTELIAKERGVTLPENWTWRDVPAEVQKEISDYGLDIVGDPDKKDPTWQYFRNTTERTRAALIARGLSQRTKEDVRGSLFAQWLRKNGYDAVAMMHDTAQGPVKHILVINEEAAKAQEGLAPEAAPEPRRVARIEPSDIETAVVPEKAGDVFANLVRRKQKVQPAVLQKPVGSQFQSPEEFRAAFDLRGQGHTRFAIRLDLMQEDGAITEDGKNLILATIWDNNTNDEFLSNMEMGSARKNVKSYGYGGRSRQTVEGGRVEQKPLLELIRATRRGGTEADKRTALTLNTFWHEFGHAGYYSLLDAKQKKAINDAYSKTTRAGRRAFFAEGKSDIENAPYFSKYYAKNESEWFAQSFAEYVITQKSDQKKLVPVFEQLLDKIKAVFTKLFNRKEQVNLNDIFDFVLRGEAYGQRPTWQGYTMSTKPAVYGTPRGQAISPEFTKRLLAREQPTTFADERRQQIIDGISLKFKRSKNEYGNNEFKTEYDFGGRSEIVDKISFSLEQFDDSTVSIDYLASKGGKYANIKLGELEQEFKGRAAAERAIKRAIAEIEMDERVGGATEPEPEAIPTFTEGTPEAATLKEMEASMAKVDAASEAKGGKPETQKISDIASNWMDQGGDERALQDAIVENTNLTPANAARVAKAIARQYDIQQSIATAFLETQTGLSVEALPEGVTLPKEVDPDRPKPVMQRLFDVFMGVRVPPVKIEVNEKTALKQQIRLKAAANRAAKAEQKRTAEEVVEIIKAMELLGPVRPKQVQALAKRAARVIWTNEKSVEAFSEYAAKVVENANYDADLRAAKDAQKRAKQLSTQKKVAMSPQRQILEDVGKVPVNKLDDPRMFAEAVNYYLRGFKDVLSPDYVVIPDAEMESYLSGAQSEAQRNQRDLDREANKRLAEKYGIDPEQVNEMMESIDILKQIEAQENREALENLLTEKAVETQQGLRGYDTDNLQADQRPIVAAMLKVDPKALDPEERQRFIRITNNIIYNNQTNGSEYFLAVAKGQQSAREAAQDSTMIAKNRAWINLLPRFISERMQRGWALELQSVADTFRNAFGKGAMAKMYDAIGMLDLNLGFTKANNVIDEIQEKIAEFHRNLEKKYKATARNQDGLLAEGVVGFLIQSVPKKDELSSINQRRDLIKQDIANRKAATMEPDRVAMANRIEAILNRIDGESVEAILNNMKREFPANHESLVWYKDTLLPQYKDFLKSFDENFNDQANNYENPNYLTIGFTSAGPSLAITPEEQSLFYDQVSLRPKQSAYTIKRVDYTTLPTDRTTGKPKEIEFNLRRNVFNSLSDQINKAYTSSGWQRIASFMKTPEAEIVFGGAANKDFFIERLNRLRLSRMRRGSMGSGGAIEKAVDSLSVISRKLGTGIALGGIYQWIKQPPDQLITALGSGGRYDLLAKNIAPSTQKAARELLNKFSIGRRGDASSGYKYINQMEGHQNRLERYFSESKWDQAKEQAGKVADVWMVALKSSDFLAASAAWMTYYEGELNKQDIKIDDWSKEAALIESDPKRRQAAAFAEQMTDIYQGSSDPTSMATFAQSGKTGWENLVKAIFVPFNSFAIQQRMRLYSDARDVLNGSAGGKGGLAGTIGGLILFHATKRYAIPAISGAGIAVLYGLMGVDMEEPDEEKQKEEANKNWRQFLADITGNLLVGGTPQIIESQFIDAMNRASYLVSLQLENDSILNDDGEIMSYDQYSKERSPFYRYKSYDNAMSLGMLEIGLGQAEQVALQTKMLATPEEMEMYTPEEQRLLYFSTLSEWLYLMRLNDADFARLVSRARRDMIKAAEDREKEIKRIREGR